MTLTKRLKNLWKLSGYEFDVLPESRRVILTDTKELAQFIEPISFRERFQIAESVDDLLNN